MKIPNYPSIVQFQQLVELKDYRPRTKSEYVRYVRVLAKHFQCDPALLSQDQIRQYFLFLRQHKHYAPAPMKLARAQSGINPSATCQEPDPLPPPTCPKCGAQMEWIEQLLPPPPDTS